jgi:exopolysaccharide biosynthesis predicted pyruvyltransferase EpsI
VKDEALLDSLRERVRVEVGRAVRRGPVALLDFPDYGNPGDSAIWLGARRCLSALGFDPPAYTSDHRTFDERSLRRALPTGTILLTGGGNLGDLWPQHQAFRERVVRRFPDHAIVQLPQSIHFGDRAATAAARAVFSAHRDLTLLVRDAKSLEVATSQLGCRAFLCPDLAFGLTRDAEPALRGRPARAPRNLLWLLRTDHEADATTTRARPEPSVDWTDDVASPIRRFARRLGDRVARRAEAGHQLSLGARGERALLSACYPRLARQRLRRATRLLQSARVVVTDRLHGHILALLLRVPHVVIGDRNGKVRGFIDTWTASAAQLRLASTPADAGRLADELLSCS